MFLKTLTTDDNYSLVNTDNLRQPIHMQLSQKWKTFSQFITTFVKPTLNFQHFKKKNDPHS